MFKLWLILGLLLAVVIGVAAQDDVTPGEGGILVQANTLGDPNFLNPLLSNSTPELAVNQFMFPNIFALDPATLLPTPGAANDEDNGLALDWTISEDGLVYTFTLRDDVVWSDGTPVTAHDYKFTFDALASGEVASPRTNVLETIAHVEAPDDTTLVITLHFPSCRAIDEMDDFGILPEHAVREFIGDDFSLINEMDFNKGPTATSGVFNFTVYVPDTQVSLAANPLHHEPVLPTGFIYKNVPDKTIALEQFLRGEVNIISQFDVAPETYGQLRELQDQGEIQLFEYTDDGYWWVALNQADSTNPQPGVDADGNLIDQGSHSIFGDLRVRQALAMALDIQQIVDGALNGNGVPALAHASTSAWAYNGDIEPYPYDPDAALKMLAEAGWVDEDDDPSTPLVATEDALYAEPGTELRFSLQYQTGDVSIDAATTIMQDLWSRIGVAVELETLEFGALVGELLSQKFDAVFLSWTNLPTDTDARSQFNPEFDIPGSGFNFVSYANAEMKQLMADALDPAKTNGCDVEARKALYAQSQQIQHDTLPYLFIYAPTTVIAVSNDITNFEPYPEALFHNVSRWTALGG
jgi:peptide/nickel transport system substrate-binding protein